MAGTGWDSSDLLTRFNAYAGRPTTDGITDAQKYQRLADAQNAVLVEIANVVPRIQYGAPTAMTSADSGYTWTFGTDGNGYSLFPLGKASIYPSLDAIPDYPWQPGIDYLDEGTQIRMPNHVPWTGSLYWYGMTQPQAMSASVQPVLSPPGARILIVIKAVQEFAEEYLRNAALADQMQIRWDREWPKYATMFRKHFRGGAQLGPLTGAYGRGGSTLGFGIGAGFG
jgi:hypothetical protein